MSVRLVSGTANLVSTPEKNDIGFQDMTNYSQEISLILLFDMIMVAGL
jgi:hypothetical protein